MKKAIRIILYIIIVLSAFHCLLNIYWGNRLHKILDTYRNSELYTLKSKLSSYPLPDKQTAALELKYIFKLMTDEEGGRLFDGNAGYDSGNNLRIMLDLYTMEDIENIMFDNREFEKTLDTIQTDRIVSYLRKAAAKSFLNFYLNYEEGPKMLLPYLPIIRELCNTLSKRAISVAQQGDPKEAYRLVIGGLKAVHLLVHEPVLISQIVRMSLELKLFKTLDFLYQRYGIDDDSGYAIIDILEHYNEVMPFLKTIDAEKILMGSFIFDGLLNRNISLKDFTELVGLRLNPVFFWVPDLFYQPFLKMNYAKYVEQLDEFKHVLMMPYWKIPDAALERIAIRHSPYLFIDSMIMPDLTKFLDKITDYKNETGRTILTTAIYLYKNKIGTFPESLISVDKVMNISTPVNQFTGKPFTYRISAGMFSVEE